MKLPPDAQYICADCAKACGASIIEGHVCTQHTGFCDVCGEEKGLCNIGDWAWPDGPKGEWD